MKIDCVYVNEIQKTVYQVKCKFGVLVSLEGKEINLLMRHRMVWDKG